MLLRRRWGLVVTLLVVGAIASSAAGSTQATKPLWCTAPLQSVNGNLQPWRGCSPFAFKGGVLLDFLVVRDRLHVISGAGLSEALLVATLAEGSGGKLEPVSCYGRDLTPAVLGTPSEPTGCALAPKGFLQGSLPWYHGFNPAHVAASPDGRQLYVGSNSEFGDRIEVVRRSPEGDLSFQSCVATVNRRDGSPCAVMEDFTYQTGQLAVSPDGERLYTVGGRGLLVLARAADGDLTPLGCVRLYQTNCREEGSRRSIAGHANPVAVSPDSKFVYVLDSRLAKSGYDRAVVEVFARTETRPGLRPVQSYLLPSPSMGAETLALAPGGRMIYVAWPERLFAMVRNKTTGKLTRKSCLASRVAGSVKGCTSARFDFGRGPIELAFSPDGRTLALADIDVLIFRRTPSTGALKQVGCVPHSMSKTAKRLGCSKVWPPFNTSGDRRELAFSSDGKRLYVSNGSSLTVIGL